MKLKVATGRSLNVCVFTRLQLGFFGSNVLEEVQPPFVMATKVGDGGSLCFGHAVFIEKANVESREKKR